MIKPDLDKEEKDIFESLQRFESMAKVIQIVFSNL